MKPSQLFVLTRIAELGDIIIYTRGRWRLPEKLPKYLVSRASTGRDLQDFRRLASAKKFARAQGQA